MSKLIRILSVTVGYFATASLITLLAGLGYLWASGKLSDDKVFRIAAVVHDVDLETIEEEMVPQVTEIPPEETSLAEKEQWQSVRMRNHELKMEQLRRGIDEYTHRRNQLQVLSERINAQARAFDQRLEQTLNQARESGNAEVVAQWEKLEPAQVMNLILTMIENGELQDVVMLITQLNDRTKKKVLAEFRDHKEELYQIESLLRQGYPQKQVIDDAREQQEQLDAQGA